MKFLQIRKRKMKFPPSTGLRGQPVAAAAHADAQPRQGGDAHVATDGAGGDPASRPTRPRQGSGDTNLHRGPCTSYYFHSQFKDTIQHYLLVSRDSP